MKKALLKDSFKEITKTYKRFISILLIVLLGVGFFAGIKATSPDMKVTLDKYFDDKNVMDFMVISTLGLTNADIDEIANLDEIENVEGSYQVDSIINVGDEDVVVKMETITQKLNELELIEGKLPENTDECVVEQKFLTGTDYKIGDKIKVEAQDIADDEGNEISLLKEKEVTIVGTVQSPMYISRERGSTKLGSGTINYYMYITKDNINTDIYTNIYIKVKDSKSLRCYKDEYEDKIEKAKNEVDSISESRKEERYNELINKANQKLQDAKNEFNTQKSDGENKIQEAEEELESAKNELKKGQQELQTNRANADRKFKEAEKKIESANNQIVQNEIEYHKQKENAEKQIKENESKLSNLKQIQAQFNSLKTMLESKKKELSKLNEKLELLEDNSDEAEDIKTKIQAINIEITKLQSNIEKIEEQLKVQGIQDINYTVNLMEIGIKTAKEKLSEAEKTLNDAKKQLKEQKKELTNTKNAAYNQISLAENKLNLAEEEIKKGEDELENSKKEFNTKIVEAEEKLKEAEEKVESIEKPIWYILDRNQNVGYASYLQDTDRVAKLAQVFPVVFFIVATFISLISMSRMVEEERVQIGTLKALGYNKLQIASKYIIYASLATIIGGVIGLFIGFNFLPKVIADIYGLMYQIPSVILEFNSTYALIGILAAICCTLGATIYSCVKELSQKPANLMRPKAPKTGKRVLLERITFIWKRFNFTQKVTARNIFRYKKRFCMTIIGVCGCTALIIAGFGLRDAISTMIPSQYGKINLYEANISLKEEYKDEELNQINNSILNFENITNILNARVESIKIDKNDNNQSIQLIVPKDINSFENFIMLKSRTNNKEKYILDNEGVIITEKLSKLLDIKVGDEIKLINSDDKECLVKVSSITENYIMHYIYMSPELYNKLYNTNIGYNVIYINTNNLSKEQEEILGKSILQNKDYFAGVTFTSWSEDVFSDIMESLNLVVWILIIAAGLLAFVVLYNLLNANITERIRELATIKVLGFYDKEVYQYISREIIILTILGIIVGIGGGYFLTLYIIKTCELDILMFNPQITIWSYLFGVVITGIFATIVNIITYFSLKKIDMIESLKSVE